MAIGGFPDFYDMVYTDSEGNLTSDAHLYNDQFNQVMNLLLNAYNQNFDSGVVMPSKTTVEITALEPSASLGTVWFNTTLAKLQVKTAAGTVETITSV